MSARIDFTVTGKEKMPTCSPGQSLLQCRRDPYNLSNRRHPIDAYQPWDRCPVSNRRVLLLLTCPATQWACVLPRFRLSVPIYLRFRTQVNTSRVHRILDRTVKNGSSCASMSSLCESMNGRISPAPNLQGRFTEWPNLAPPPQGALGRVSVERSENLVIASFSQSGPSNSSLVQRG